MPLKLTTYYHGKDIPDLPGNNTFHSKELFQIYEATHSDFIMERQELFR